MNLNTTALSNITALNFREVQCLCNNSFCKLRYQMNSKNCMSHNFPNLAQGLENFGDHFFLEHRVVEGRDNEMLEGNPSFHMTTGHIKACQVHLEKYGCCTYANKTSKSDFTSNSLKLIICCIKMKNKKSSKQ